MIHISSNLTTLARQLRKDSTKAERALWRELAAKRFFGIKFRRQQPIENFIVDFICYEKKIVIEIDGGQHACEQERLDDAKRDAYLKKIGYNVLRFWNNDVLSNIEGVLEKIRQFCV